MGVNVGPGLYHWTIFFLLLFALLLCQKPRKSTGWKAFHVYMSRKCSKRSSTSSVPEYRYSTVPS